MRDADIIVPGSDLAGCRGPFGETIGGPSAGIAAAARTRERAAA